MTLDEARRHIGAAVVYIPSHGAREDGTITSVSDHWVHVRYRGDVDSKATPPERLELLVSNGASR